VKGRSVRGAWERRVPGFTGVREAYELSSKRMPSAKGSIFGRYLQGTCFGSPDGPRKRVLLFSLRIPAAPV